MNHLLCFSAASLLTATSKHSLVWRCLYLLLFSVVALLGAREWRRNYKSAKIISSGTTENSSASETATGWTLRSLINRRHWHRVSDEERRIPHRKGHAIFHILLMVTATFGLTFAITRTPKYPVETHHNVYVWSQVKDSNHAWWVSADDLPFSIWACCPDYDCRSNVWAGYIATTVRYEDRSGCKSIRAGGLGWFWERDEYGNVKEW